MSYASDHLAWQQRVLTERQSAYRFLETQKQYASIFDPFN